MTEGTITTRLFPTQGEVAAKYKAHVLLTEDRAISKEQAVNELILIGAKAALPKDLTRDIPTYREQPADDKPTKGKGK